MITNKNHQYYTLLIQTVGPEPQDGRPPGLRGRWLQGALLRGSCQLKGSQQAAEKWQKTVTSETRGLGRTNYCDPWCSVSSGYFYLDIFIFLTDPV